MVIPNRQELKQAIDELPAEVLPELASFMEYLRYKTAVRDRKAFLNSYSPEDEGLYNDLRLKALDRYK